MDIQLLIAVALGLPVVWFLGGLVYQIMSLIYLWLKFKLENIKEIF